MEILDLSLVTSPTPQLPVLVEAQPAPRPEVDRDHWTYKQRTDIRKALNELATINTPNFIGKVALKVPGKSIDQVQSFYESNSYKQQGDDMHVLVKNDQLLPLTVPKSFANRRKASYWTVKEHERFLLGINKYGRGMWKQISENYVKSKTATQVSTHAQSFFNRIGRDHSSRRATKFSKIIDAGATAATHDDPKPAMDFSSSSKSKVLDDSDDDVILLESPPHELIPPRRRNIPRTLNLFPEVSDLASSCQHDHEEEEDITLNLFPKYPMNTCI